MHLTHELQIEFHLYNKGIRRAKAAYYDGPTFVHICPQDVCTDAATCTPCRRRAERDLLVATSEAEAAHLLALIDRPLPPKGPAAIEECGTDAARRRHRRAGEHCNICRIDQGDSLTCTGCGVSIERKKSGGRPKQFCSSPCRLRYWRRERP